VARARASWRLRVYEGLPRGKVLSRREDRHDLRGDIEHAAANDREGLGGAVNSIRVHKTGGPEVLRIEEVPDPTPGPGALVVNIEAIGVNYLEIYQREGLYTVQRPFTPGSEAAGTVRALGRGVAAFRVGVRGG